MSKMPSGKNGIPKPTVDCMHLHKSMCGTYSLVIVRKKQSIADRDFIVLAVWEINLIQYELFE